MFFLIVVLITLLHSPLDLFAQDSMLNCQEVQDLVQVMGNDETHRLLEELGMDCSCITEDFLSELKAIQADESLISTVRAFKEDCYVTIVNNEMKETAPNDMFAIGARINYNVDITPRTDEDYYYTASSIAYDINLTFKLFPSVYVELGGSQFSADVIPWSGKSNGDKIGDLTITSYTGGILYRDALKYFNIKSVYVGLGVIYFTADELETDNLWLSRDENNYKVNKIDVESAMGFYIGSGYEYYVTDNLALNLDGKLMFNTAKLNTTMDVTRLGEVEGDKINISYFNIGFGLKYYLY